VNLAVTNGACVHCGLPTAPGRRFCCPGCGAAAAAIEAAGLGAYYRRRVLDPAARPPRPEPAQRWDLGRCVTEESDGTHSMTLAVDGLQCGACVWLIEQVLAREPDVTIGRVNMTTRRLRIAWRGAAEEGERLVGLIEQLGYRLVPFEPAALAAAQDRTGRALLRALAVAGFATGNVMLASVAIWAGLFQDMGPATRALLHWESALIAMPAVAYAGMPFFRSAFAALRHGHTNMDVPISIGVLLVTALSLVQTMRGGAHAYFDSATSLLFFLLIGRVLDHRARQRARAGAEQLLALRAADVAVLMPDGTTQRRAAAQVQPGARVLVGMGERVGVDGVVERGETTLDASLVSGESLPVAAKPGAAVFAGTVNLGPPITVRTTAVGTATLLAECVRLIEAAEARKTRFVALADRVARRYAPAVHVAAAATFLWWRFVAAASVTQALLIACSVLIITCPCALALAVPAVQVIATARLFRAGVLLKSPTALERLAEVDTVVFDKTGTLTHPAPALVESPRADVLARAASLAAASRHPLARALLAASGPVPPAQGVQEHPGLGLSLVTGAGELRLGSGDFVGAPPAPSTDGPELWFAVPGSLPVRFAFAERLREDAAETVQALRSMGLRLLLASGDRAGPVARIAARLGVDEFHAECRPTDKVALIERLRAEGRRVLMVGDGLNDGPCLAAASVSISPASAADISQTVADVVFQGARLAPVVAVLRLARRARAVMRQNLALAFAYNAVTLPLAVLGWVTPWLAAACMSASSLAVMANSLRLGRAQ
jgi:Cu2+-exporting ATPase